MHGDSIAILVEAKKAQTDLKKENREQLYRYFSVTKARIALLTNGTVYEFYSDLDEPNKMDKEPFLVLDLENLREDLLPELTKLTKESYDLDHMLTNANEVKYKEAIRIVLKQQFDAPDEEFVKYFFRTVKGKGSVYSPSAKELFTRLVDESCKQYIADRVSVRLRSALAQEEEPVSVVLAPQKASAETEDVGDAEEKRDNGVVTTEEELQASKIVRAIVCDTIPLARVADRDTKSYFGILIDDNNRQPLCRLHFNRRQKYIGIIKNGDEEKFEINELNDIYSLAGKLREAAKGYLEPEKKSALDPDVANAE